MDPSVNRRRVSSRSLILQHLKAVLKIVQCLNGTRELGIFYAMSLEANTWCDKLIFRSTTGVYGVGDTGYSLCSLYYSTRDTSARSLHHSALGHADGSGDLDLLDAGPASCDRRGPRALSLLLLWLWAVC